MKVLKNKFLFQNSYKRSTLLIPNFLLPSYKTLMKQHGTMRNVLNVLLQKFFANKTNIIFKNNLSSTLQFQIKGLQLQRIDFRPISSDWVTLKLLANSYNLSICAFFVVLLERENAGGFTIKKTFGGTTSSFPKIILHLSLSKDPTPEFRKLLKLRI